MTATLALFDNNTSANYNDFGIDDLSFNASGASAPEPATWLLGVTALAGLAVARRLFGTPYSAK